ncbi:MAG: PTS sugar transporter subunit IIA [Planctomycetes bacterium]|nr:PTS sugar transporter subunit IIA [Planctomycetota bacterium]
MALTDYLSAETICVDMRSQDREQVVRAMLQCFVTAELISEQLIDDALKAILDRERMGSTAIGRGVAVPHARLEALDRILVAFACSGDGVDFNALDRGPVHYIFLVIATKDSTEEYVNVMERISRLIQNDDFLRFVSRASNAEDALALIDEMDS